jgi:anti-anti-sigma factor
MAELFRVSRAGEVGVVELDLPETLDVDEFGRLNESLSSLVAGAPGGGAAWVLDLSRLAYAGSAALGLIVNLRQKVKEADGRLVLCGLSDRLLTVFRTCSLERLFVVRRSREEAIDRAR